jgi:hypothetical protein
VYLCTYDANRLVYVALHVGGPLTESDVDVIVASIERGIRDSAARGNVPFSILVVIETNDGPTPMQRKRIGEAAAAIPRAFTAFVFPSPVIRAVITALGWFKRKSENVHSAHGSYEAACAWLVKETGHPSAVFDTALSELRARVRESGSRKAVSRVSE